VAFKRAFLSGRVVSDEGFAVLVRGQDTLEYCENGRKMSISIDCGGNGIVVFADSVSRWDDDPSASIDEQTRAKITDNIVRALRFKVQPRGGHVDLHQ